MSKDRDIYLDLLIIAMSVFIDMTLIVMAILAFGAWDNSSLGFIFSMGVVLITFIIYKLLDRI